MIVADQLMTTPSVRLGLRFGRRTGAGQDIESDLFRSGYRDGDWSDHNPPDGDTLDRAQAVLFQHAWPGNVRELENVISCACLTSANEFIDVDDLPENLQKPAAPSGRAAAGTAAS